MGLTDGPWLIDAWSVHGAALGLVMAAVLWHASRHACPEPRERRIYRGSGLALAAAVAAATAASAWPGRLAFMEGASLCLYLLIRRRHAALARVYLLVQMAGVAFLLVAAGAEHQRPGAATMGWAFPFLLLGLGLKLGLAGLHAWLPAVYDGVPVAFGALPSTLALTLPVAMLGRLLAEPHPVVAWAGLITALTGAMGAVLAPTLGRWAAGAAMSWTGGLLYALGTGGAGATVGAQSWLGSHLCAKAALLLLAVAGSPEGRSATGDSPSGEPFRQPGHAGIGSTRANNEPMLTVAGRAARPLLLSRRFRAWMRGGCRQGSGWVALGAIMAVAGVPPTLEGLVKARLTGAAEAGIPFWWLSLWNALGVAYAGRAMLLLHRQVRQLPRLPAWLGALLLTGLLAWDLVLGLGDGLLGLPWTAVSRWSGWSKLVWMLPLGWAVLAVIDRLAARVARDLGFPHGSVAIDGMTEGMRTVSGLVGRFHIGNFRFHLLVMATATLVLMLLGG